MDVIKSELDFIKDHIVDRDSILTSEEEERFDEALEDLKKGRTISLADFEKEMKKNNS